VRVLVVGLGAIGGPVAGYLASAGHDVRGVDAWSEHVEAINRNGMRITGARGEHRFWFPAMLWDELEVDTALELAFVCVKGYDTARAADLLAPLLGSSSIVVSTQNGMNEEILGARLGTEHILGAVTEIGGYIVAPGEIAETRADGGFVIGELDGSDSSRLERARDALAACAPTVTTSTIRSLLWSKLTWNCMMNPLTTLAACGQGEVWLTPRLQELALAVGRESAAVAGQEGAPLEALTFLGVDLPALLSDDSQFAEATLATVVERYRSQAQKSTSMREDVARGRPTEIEALNGHVVRRGRELGVSVPLNSKIVESIRAVERGELVPGLQTVEALQPSLGRTR
jgi:2-dehydropantoate 2-reductase